jgi:hypothetical protein
MTSLCNALAGKHGNSLPLPNGNPATPSPPTWPPHIHPPKEAQMPCETLDLYQTASTYRAALHFLLFSLVAQPPDRS